MILAQLDFGQTVAAGAFNAFFTAALVSIVATIAVRWYDNRAEVLRQGARQLHEEQLQKQALEHESSSALRDTYAQLLVAQRRTRQASVLLAEAGGVKVNESLANSATLAHDEFIDLYHRLSLDASREMWLEARSLRDILDKMLEHGRNGNRTECEGLVKTARSARQNLERSFRVQLLHEPLQRRKTLGEYDKSENVGSTM
jgi:hypothetical protein